MNYSESLGIKELEKKFQLIFEALEDEDGRGSSQSDEDD